MKIKQCYFLILLATSLLNSQAIAATKGEGALPENFTYLHEVDPSIIQEMRYATDHNFIGKPFPGYLAAKCILTIDAAKALSAVQAELKKFSMSLKVYDCYRPQKTVDYFITWAADAKDVKMKKEFYPQVDKADFFKDGYVAKKSGHSRGSTVDLTIVSLPLSEQEQYRDGEKLTSCYAPANKRFKDNSLDFGTGYDCLDPLSNTENTNIGGLQKQRRLMFRAIIEKNGFKNSAVEWWHYTLEAEPFPDLYFNFDVK